MNNKKIKTGIQDLDRLLETELSTPTMKIDKEVFDSTILPLLADRSLQLTPEERFEHIKNIWINCYNSEISKSDMSRDYADGNATILSGALFTSMSIIDESGNVVAITPSLIEPAIIEDASDILTSFSNEMKVNPSLAQTRFVKAFNDMNISTDPNRWRDFLSTYIPQTDTIADGNINDSSSSTGNSLLEEC